MEERQKLLESQEALSTCQVQLAEASTGQQQLQSQHAELQLRMEESAAQHTQLHTAVQALEKKLAASEADLTGAQSQVSPAYT